jgi:hypothetical protein
VIVNVIPLTAPVLVLVLMVESLLASASVADDFGKSLAVYDCLAVAKFPEAVALVAGVHAALTFVLPVSSIHPPPYRFGGEDHTSLVWLDQLLAGNESMRTPRLHLGMPIHTRLEAMSGTFSCFRLHHSHLLRMQPKRKCEK